MGKEKPKARKAEAPKEEIRGLKSVMPARLNAATVEQPEWEELEIAVDSAATERVLMDSQLTNVKTTDGKPFKMEMQYELQMAP